MEQFVSRALKSQSISMRLGFRVEGKGSFCYLNTSYPDTWTLRLRSLEAR